MTIFAQVTSIIMEVISVCTNWFLTVIISTDMMLFYVGSIAVWTSYKFILAPLFGVAHSDTIKSSYNAFKQKKKE